MDKNWKRGIWLLLDAAGPATVIGLVRNGQWLEYLLTEDTFLEGSQAAVECLLKDNGLSLNQLSGVLYGSGPGSTLGLRLAAMFIRTLTQLPGLQDWQCAQFNNLEVAAASLIESGQKDPVQAVAPWRRDRVHRVVISHSPEIKIESGFLHPENLDMGISVLFPLGKRAANLPPVQDIRPFPIEDLPAILNRFPQLVVYTDNPSPYSAETPEFARWNSKRHPAK